MDKPSKIALASLTCTAALLVSACGAGNEPQQSSPATPPAASASPTTPAASPAGSSPAPSADPSQAAPQVKAATEKFVKTALTLGYPDKTADDYYDRVEPLMTKRGLAQQKKNFGDLDKTAAQLYAQRVRGNSKITSGAKVTAVDAAKASAQVSYRLTRQQQIGGKWKTIGTSDDKSTLRVTLVNDHGSWLVDTAE